MDGQECLHSCTDGEGAVFAKSKILAHRALDGIINDMDWTELEQSDPSNGDEGDGS